MGLIVDAAHRGTPESAWSSSDRLRGVPAIDLPRVRRALVVAPHRDDEVLGAGGLVQRLLAASVEIQVLAVTDSEGSHPRSPAARAIDLAGLRTAEVVTALGYLGWDRAEVTRLGIPDGHVGEYQDVVPTPSAPASSLAICASLPGPMTGIPTTMPSGVPAARLEPKSGQPCSAIWCGHGIGPTRRAPTYPGTVWPVWNSRRPGRRARDGLCALSDPRPFLSAPILRTYRFSLRTCCSASSVATRSMSWAQGVRDGVIRPLVLRRDVRRRP